MADTKENKESTIQSLDYKTGYPVPKHRFEPIARVLLMAVYDDNHIFSKLRGMRFIVKAIWELTLQFNKHHWPKSIDSYNQTALAIIKTNISIPSPQDININMMPFIMNNDFNKTKLPNYCKGYHHIIQLINNNDKTLNNKICFLTIQESFVDKDKTQRRPGLHIETPGNYGNVLGFDEMSELQSKHRTGHGNCPVSKDRMITWGRGLIRELGHGPTEIGGIYMISNIHNSCRAWDCIIKDDAVGHLGDIEHLRNELNGYILTHTVNKQHGSYRRLIPFLSGNLYWITDRTPHESLPMKREGYRQFFRLVTSEVDVWYEQHSTKNPNGVVPDPNITKIIKTSKFQKK